MPQTKGKTEKLLLQEEATGIFVGDLRCLPEVGRRWLNGVGKRLFD
jgi:hypothetical protein